MADSKTMVKTFRLVMLLSAVLAIVSAGLLVDASMRETMMSESVQDLYRRHDEVTKWCAENDAPSCRYSRELKDTTLPSYMEARRANRERADTYLWMLMAVPAIYLLFLLVRYALTARLRPFWPWRLDQAAAE
ncbi:hypothetical protein ABIC83_002912 [Roseateles asaccharophilus]|uniref:hypothetical protein n=1 Tax=Roseateles asaccharophilus TaxID=582607 RepID=UPI003835AD2C